MSQESTETESTGISGFVPPSLKTDGTAKPLPSGGSFEGLILCNLSSTAIDNCL